MNEKAAIALFVGLGLVGAYFGLSPLRKKNIDVNRTYVEGTISLADSLQGKAKPEAALFIFVKAFGMQGAPLAVRKVNYPIFPVSFRLTAADSMGGMEFYEGDLTVTARVSQSGTAGPKQPGDWEAVVQLPQGQPRTLQIQINE